MRINLFILNDKHYTTIKSLHENLLNDNNFETRLYYNNQTEALDKIKFADCSIITSPYSINFDNLAQKSNKVAYIGYGPLIKYPQQYPICHLKRIWKYFVGDKYNEKFLINLGESNKIVKLGHPKYDLICRPIDKAEILKKYKINLKQTTVLYTPTIQKWGKYDSWYSTFKVAINDILDICSKFKVLLIIKAHPSLFEGTMKLDFSSYKNVIFTQTMTMDYVGLLKIADFCISDPSGILFEYIFTLKPIILLPTQGSLENSIVRNFASICYTPSNCNGLFKAIKNLIEGKDDLKKNRELLLKEKFYPNNGKAGFRIKEWLKNYV